MQMLLSFSITAVPVAAVLWLSGTYILPGTMSTFGSDLRAGPFLALVWHLTLYTFFTTWVTIVLTSVLGCIFIRLHRRFTRFVPVTRAQSGSADVPDAQDELPSRHSGRGPSPANTCEPCGYAFRRVGGSECDVMHNLVPELATADAQVFWSNSCFTNMLDYGAEHIKLRQLDMPHNFFTGNNCVAEYGHLPSNFLLGVSTPVSDINFRRQMQSRLESANHRCG